MIRELLITAGTGPEEVRSFVAQLAQQLEADCASRGLTVAQTTCVGPEEAPRSVTLRVRGAASLSDWVGTHVLVAPSPRRGKRGRKRWYAGVSVLKPLDTQPVTLDAKDLRVTACRAGGPGGQHVNTCASAVRATHLPSGLSVRVQSERSQHANRRLALRRLGEALAARQAQRLAGRRDSRWRRHHQLERGRPVQAWRPAPEGNGLTKREV